MLIEHTAQHTAHWTVQRTTELPYLGSLIAFRGVWRMSSNNVIVRKKENPPFLSFLSLISRFGFDFLSLESTFESKAREKV